MLWRASQSALRTSTVEHEHIRSDHLAVQALLCGFLAYEGFVNLVGEEIAPDIWKDERPFFGSGEFQGIAGKVAYLYSVFPDASLKKGENPYQTFERLRRIRDALAHNRAHHYEEVSPEEDPTFATRFDNFDTPQKVEPALLQLKLLAEVMRLEALKLLFDEYRQSHLHHHAFEGPLGTSSGSQV